MGYNQLALANEICCYAKKQGVELKLSPEHLQALKEDYKQQLEGYALDHFYNPGWEGCPEVLEDFAKDKKDLELVLQEALQETYNEKDWFVKEKIRTYAKERGLRLI